MAGSVEYFTDSDDFKLAFCFVLLDFLGMSKYEDAVEAIINKDEHRSWIATSKDQPTLTLFVSDEDAWDYDIEKGLHVLMYPESGTEYCKIVKKYSSTHSQF